MVLWLWLESARLLPKRVLGLLAVARVSSLLSKESVLGRPVARSLGSSQRSHFGEAASKRYAFSAVRERLQPCTRNVWACLVLLVSYYANENLTSFLQAHYRLERRVQQRDGSVACTHELWERLGHLRQAITKNTAASASQDRPERCVAAQADTQVDLATNS